MIEKLANFTNNLIFTVYILLAIATPLILTTFNSELFEVPKMHFVYTAATIILAATATKFILERKISLPSSLATYLLLAFIAAQIASTFFSIDKFTSFFGYPSRLNGGLLSQFAYLVVFAGALINLDIEKAKKILLAIVVGAVAVSLWGIPSHFGYDPSCLIFSGKLTSSCWQEDFNPTVRIFSTLGQPNWLASYLVLTIPITLALAIQATSKNFKNLMIVSSILLFTALVMTNSLSGFLGIAVTAAIFALLIGIKKIKDNINQLLTVLVTFTIVTIVFGGFLYERFTENVISRQLVTSDQEPVTEVQQPAEPRGTPSGDIRLIVWQGAVDAFKNKPLLGFGPETFAYSYFQFRPLAHNNTSEWNFFYNKAHNEFLNYLANIGVVGTALYFTFIASAVFLIFKNVKNSVTSKAIIAAIAGYHTTIFFGFSTVASQLVMYLYFAIGLIIVGTKQSRINLTISKTNQIALSSVALLLFLVFFSIPIRLIFADILFARADKISTSKPTTALEIYTTANNIHPTNDPFIISQAAYQSALIAAASQNTTLAENANLLTILANKIAPGNFVVERRIANSYLLISDFGENFKKDAISSGKKLVLLAPTNPESYLTLAKVYIGTGDLDAASRQLETAIKLKADYIEARELLDQVNKQRLTSGK